MWTNIYRIGGLHQLSWFQFLPNESELSQLPDKSGKWERKECLGKRQVLSAHIQLQKEGFLSTWTNSFVGPWDPSQGLHNPDEKIKLWLFLPGRHSSIVDNAAPFLSKLRVAASGVWMAPGDSEEVSSALSQSLRNCIQTALLGQSYLRFGDVFTKSHSLQFPCLLRKGQITIELVFSATEESVYVHVVVSAKHIRTLSNSDMDSMQKQLSHNSGYRLPVIVPPHGLRGWLTGCCPNDLVKQVYLSSGKVSTSSVVAGVPWTTSLGIGCLLKGQYSFAEVMLGCHKSDNGKALQSCSYSIRDKIKINAMETPIYRVNGSYDLSDHQRTFFYPTESVIFPMVQTISAKFSMKRFWLQNLAGPSFSASSLFSHCGSEADFLEGQWSELFSQPFPREYNSSNNSNTSSISSVSCSSCDSDQKMLSTTGELEADADSLSCRQSSLSTNDQFEMDGPKSGSKRLRTGIVETFGVEADLEWDDAGGVNISIQALLSEFGDFGGFFETDKLDFGEPPGTAESHVPIYPATECHVGSSPIGIMDVSNPMLLPIGYPSLETFNPPLADAVDDSLSKSEEIVSSNLISGSFGCPPSVEEFDHLIKAEALMTFAPEYGAVEAPSSDFSSSIFKTPYFPKSHKVENSSSSTSNYRYGATPPLSPCLDATDEKNVIVNNPIAAEGKFDPKKYYTQVVSGRELKDRKSIKLGKMHAMSEDVIPSFSTVTSASTSKSVHNKIPEETENVVLPSRTVLATDIECLMFQTCMCSDRHTHFSLDNPGPINTSRLSGSNTLHQFSGDGSTMTENTSSKYDMQKMESIPMRITGDFDSLLDGHPTTAVGVWRSVGIPKVMMPLNASNVEVVSSLQHHALVDDGLLSYGQRQPLQDLLNSIPLLVQQATSFVDFALDGITNDGPFSWLALQEQWRRGLCCGPSAVHAGCGGTLAASHFLDIAGVELVDPFSAEVVASNAVSLLQSEIKTALKAAFKNLDGPLSVSEWFKGRGSLVDGATLSDGSYADSTVSDYKDSTSAISTSVGDSMSPAQSSGGCSTSFRADKGDDSSQRRHGNEIETEHYLTSRFMPVIVPPPSILIGYQDDWLKTSTTSLQLWEKAPFEPYALPKPVTYHVICPEIDPLTSAAADFFQQLGTVYETCKLGSHLPQASAIEMEQDSGKCSTSGFVLLDCPQSVKIESTNASLVGSISDYFLSLSNGWDLTSYLKSLSKAIRTLKFPFSSTMNREGNTGPFLVIYVVCPFPEPTAVLQTIIESSIALGSVSMSLDRERKSALHNQVGKALSCSTSFDEASASNVVVISGFSIPKLVLQIVTVDAIFRVSSPALNELVALKEIAFTVYNKARRISKGSFNDVHFSTLSNRTIHLGLPQIASVSGMWKDCIAPCLGGPSHSREGEIDSSLRSGAWDSSWQTRTVGLNGDQNRNGEYFLLQDDIRYMFEPLFILSEPGSLEYAVATMSCEASKVLSDDTIGGSSQNILSPGIGDAGSGGLVDRPEDGFGSCYQKTNPTLHCCYGWTEDWRWLVCIWSDARGELLDSHLFPFGGISSRQDTKGLQCVFMQVLQQGCQILQACSSTDMGVAKPRDFVISRIGTFLDLEYLEWQKAIYAVGGSEMKRWPVQLRRQSPDGISPKNNGSSMQPPDMSLIQDRTLPSSPSPYGHPKPSSFMKNSMGQTISRKPLLGRIEVDYTRGILQSVQSITFATISVDHSLQLSVPAESPASGAQSGVGWGHFASVQSLGSTSASHFIIPPSNFRFLSPSPLQLPTCLTAESPPLAHLLHSRGSAIPLLTGFVVSKAVPSIRSDNRNKMGEEWPAVLAISLVDYYGGANASHDSKLLRRTSKQGVQPPISEVRDVDIQARAVLESLAAELHALSWMTVSPVYLERRTALPFHCDMVLRLQRLLHYADRELSSQQDPCPV